jgi:5-oxoprolinase (ATP-hydrolysing)
MNAAIISSHRKIPPFGLKGGMPGKCGKDMLIRRDGRVIEVEGQVELKLKNGYIFVIETPGGGGYGRHVHHNHEKNKSSM